MNKHKSFWLCFIAISNRMKMKNNNTEQNRNAVVWWEAVGTTYERCECGRWWATVVLTQQMGDMVAGGKHSKWEGCTDITNTTIHYKFSTRTGIQKIMYNNFYFHFNVVFFFSGKIIIIKARLLLFPAYWELGRMYTRRAGMRDEQHPVKRFINDLYKIFAYKYNNLSIF